MNVLCFIAAVLLLLASTDMSSAYYDFLRVVISVAAVAGLIASGDRAYRLLAWAFIAIGLLFNPIFPIYLHDKATWEVLDIGAALVFFLAGLAFSTPAETTDI